MALCTSSSVYSGSYDPTRVVVCGVCELAYDHKRILGDRVVLKHKCPGWVPMGYDKYGPCVLPVHPAWEECIAERAQVKTGLMDYSGCFPRAHDRLDAARRAATQPGSSLIS